MIPTVEQICNNLLNGTITLEQAIAWLLMHEELDTRAMPEGKE